MPVLFRDADREPNRKPDEKEQKQLVRSRKIDRVGKVNRGKYPLTYQISLKKEGFLLLNEFGWKLINEI